MVTGAPGDGSSALTTAIQRELSKNGLQSRDVPDTQAYKVEGKVAMGQSKDGKQPIQIDWNVIDPRARNSERSRRKTKCRKARSTAPGARRRMPPRRRAAQGIIKLLPAKSRKLSKLWRE